MAPSKSSAEGQGSTENQIKSTSDFIDRKADKLCQRMEKRMDQVDTDSTHILSNQYSAIQLMLNRLRHIDREVAHNAEVAEGRHSELHPDQRRKVPSPDLKLKKKELQRAINTDCTHVGKLTHKKVQEMATAYVALVDEDQNGTIEKNEFLEFFTNFDGVCLSEDEINQMFEDADADGSGHLSVQEFAECLFLIIVPEGFEDMEEQ